MWILTITTCHLNVGQRSKLPQRYLIALTCSIKSRCDCVQKSILRGEQPFSSHHLSPALKVTYSSDATVSSKLICLCRLSQFFPHGECFRSIICQSFLNCCLLEGPSPKALRVTYYPNRVNLSCKASPPLDPPSGVDTDCQCYNTRNVSLIHIRQAISPLKSKMLVFRTKTVSFSVVLTFVHLVPFYHDGEITRIDKGMLINKTPARRMIMIVDHSESLFAAIGKSAQQPRNVGKKRVQRMSA